MASAVQTWEGIEDRSRAREGAWTLERLARAMSEAYTDVEEEVDVNLEVTSGKILSGLSGTLFRNGPGKLSMAGRKYAHPFDGDGMVMRFAFEDGKVRYRNRFVETLEFIRELSRGRPLYRNFGTPRPGGVPMNAGRMHFKNAANTAVLPLDDGRVLTLWEGGLPHALDADTLATHGREHLDGMLLNTRSKLDAMVNPELPFSAHPRQDPRSRTIHNFGLAFGVKHRLMLYEIGPDGTPVSTHAHELEQLAFMHDFVLTPNYRVFLETPVRFRIARMLAGMCTPAGSLKRTNRPMHAMLVSRHDNSVRRIPVPQCDGYVFHFTNGFEVDDDTVVVDGYVMKDMPSPAVWKAMIEGVVTDYPLPKLTRFVIDLRADKVETTLIHDMLGEFPSMNPSLHGSEYRYTWGNAIPPTHGLPSMTAVAKWDVEDASKTIFHDFYPDLPGEPIFVPDESSDAEDSGWLLTLVYRCGYHRTDLVMQDARTLRLVATCRMPHHIPPGFHGRWMPSR